MEAAIEAIVQKLRTLPEANILEVLDFVEHLAQKKEHWALQSVEDDLTRNNNEAFEEICDRLADEFERCVGATAPVLSD